MKEFLANVWCAFYNDDTYPNPDPNRHSHLIKYILCLNGSWIDERIVLLK